MATVTIASAVGASMSAATGRPCQSHLIYATNNHKWYLFYLAGTQTLTLASSPDFVTWTRQAGGSDLTLVQPHNSEGRSYGFWYDNIAGIDLVHMAADYRVTTTFYSYHARFSLGPSAFTVTNGEALVGPSSPSSNAYLTGGPTTLLDWNNIPVDLNPFMQASGSAFNMTITGGTGADTGTAWVSGFGTPQEIYAIPSYCPSSGCLIPFANSTLAISDDGVAIGGFSQLIWSQTTPAWSAGAFVLESAVLQTSSEQWGCVRVSDVDTHVVALSDNISTLVHTRFDGSVWTGNASAGVAAPPALTLAANSGLFLANDGINVWLVAIDSTYNVQYIKWAAATSSWDAAWSILAATTGAVRSHISGFQQSVGGKIGVIWTQTNGANYDIVGTTFTATSSVTAQMLNLYRRRRSG